MFVNNIVAQTKKHPSRNLQLILTHHLFLHSLELIILLPSTEWAEFFPILLSIGQWQYSDEAEWGSAFQGTNLLFV